MRMNRIDQASLERLTEVSRAVWPLLVGAVCAVVWLRRRNNHRPAPLGERGGNSWRSIPPTADYHPGTPMRGATHTDAARTD